ncbi:MAG: response regulator [Hydrogenophaga sp.]|uniref:response regulator n=1 Tax=Hydrogenophaga sp. TaxID=1904254 RepID=UPI002745F4B5|nr:response regulator [Hydrogenophaga sp.]MDP2418343.1 response regulator [Hydrogenophaga sp.]MDZ4187023.1 response regulator [Hydrogenophaga sp.]
MARRIMLIDDYESDLLFTRLMLERCDQHYEVLEYDSALEALQYLQSNPLHGISLILLDINMPGMDGFEFLEVYENLADGKQAEAVVVMLTSSPDPRDRARAEAFGSVRGYITKPIDKATASGLMNFIGQN